MERVDLAPYRAISVIRLLGLSTKRQAILCPFHNESTPSCYLYTDGGFHCFGCGAHGRNAIDFLDKMGERFSDIIKHLTNLL